jgi:hypothetical protein
MSAYIFTKETKGFSISKDGSKVSYAGAFSFTGHSSGTTATIKINESGKLRLNDSIISIGVDTVTIGVTPFAGTASGLIDTLRDTVFFN